MSRTRAAAVFAANCRVILNLRADHTVHEFSKRSHGLGSTRGKLYKTRIEMCPEIVIRTCFPMFRWFTNFGWLVSEYFISWRRGTATILIYSVNSSDPETATFVLHKDTKIICCLFLQESPAVAREDALQPIQFLLHYWPLRSSKVNNFYVIWKPIYVTFY